MGWEAILQLVLMIITMIMEYLGGGSFTRVIHGERPAVHRLASYQWRCDDPRWAQQPAVKNGEFNGTLSMSCEVEGLSGGGLTELQKHFEAQLKDSAAEIHGGPYVRTSAGYPSQAYDVSLELEAGNERTRMRGETVIATDGVTGLVSNFRSTQPPRSGNAAYLKHVEDSVKVTSTLRRGWYRVELTQTSRVKKPWLVGNSAFLREVTRKAEDNMVNRREWVLNDLADNL